MRRLLSLILASAMAICLCANAKAETIVKARGDMRVYGTYFANHNFTGWNSTGTKTEDQFEIWQRFRPRFDFEANKNLYFRLGLKVDTIWGYDTYTAANPTAALMVELAYLQFKYPDTDIQVAAGLQFLSLPQSKLFNSSVVWSNPLAAVVVNAPLIPETLTVQFGFGRLLDTNRSFDNSTTQVGDELDAYFLTLPVTLDGFKATPWAMVAVAGRNANYALKNSNDFPDLGGTNFTNTLFSAASYANMTASSKLGSWKNSQNPYYWFGGAFEVSALDPVRFYADVVYGAGAMGDAKAARRHGWMVDAGAEYTGFTVFTPQLFAWWASGEDKSTGNGSERLPYLRSQWGAGNSFLFESDQALGRNYCAYARPVGNYGIGLSLANISFVEKLTNQLTFAYAHGNNAARALRTARTYSASYMTMGHDLGENESMFGINLDTKYMIYENLAAIVETGWAHGQFQESIWGHRLYHQAESNGNNEWKVAFGFTYKW
ncbi:MAG TPA: outer membrane homotrimeric porin [Solidesulfovibrio sp.]|nr:outer membrane homotrimeric porin [Solidesulfovibrio sp.]